MFLPFRMERFDLQTNYALTWFNNLPYRVAIERLIFRSKTVERSVPGDSFLFILNFTVREYTHSLECLPGEM